MEYSDIHAEPYKAYGSHSNHEDPARSQSHRPAPPPRQPSGNSVQPAPVNTKSAPRSYGVGATPPAPLGPQPGDDGPTARYPPNAIPNPSALLPCVRKLGATNLRRPQFLPRELDSRFATEGIYNLIKTDPGTEPNVVYLVPGACVRCTSLRQFCDRGEPSCSRCAHSGAACALGPLQALNLNLKRQAQTSATVRDPSAVEDATGRGKRVKKPRRLSDADEGPQTLVSVDRATPAKTKPHKLDSHLPSIYGVPLRPEDVEPTAQDIKYNQRVEENAKKPAMKYFKECPLWAMRRHAFYAATDSLRNPTPTVGASVQIGESGVARGVLLEGSPTLKAFWGQGVDVGTIVAAIGPTRKRYDRTMVAQPPKEHESPLDKSNTASSKELAARVNAETSSKLITDILSGAEHREQLEPPPLEALFLAQRARTPICLAVSEDYSGMPFSLPRPFMTLGWYWVTDSWTVLTGDRDTVAWLFQFECCWQRGDAQTLMPWWGWDDEPDEGHGPMGTPFKDEDVPPWPVRGPGISGSPTYRGRQRANVEALASQDIPQTIGEIFEANLKGSIACPTCKLCSETVYETQAPCLNERCRDFCKDVRRDGNARPPFDPAGCPGMVRLVARILPGQLNIGLIDDGMARYSGVRLHDALRDPWQAWVCRVCRCANERGTWFGFMCDGCGVVDKRKRIIYSAEALAPSTKRPGEVLWDVPAEVVGTVNGSHEWEVSHSGKRDLRILYSTAAALDDANRILLGLQEHGASEVPFSRQYLSATSSRPTELTLCPFYTVAFGDIPLSHQPHFPIALPIHWSRAPRVTQYFSPQSAILIVAMPLVCQKQFAATFIIAHEDPVLHFYGSDCHVRLKHKATRTRLGVATAHHGDSIGFRNGPDNELEVQVKMDGFGFIVLQTRKSSTPTAEAGDPTGKPLPQWYMGAMPLDKSQPLRSIATKTDYERDAYERASDGDGLPLPKQLIIKPALPYRGAVVEAPFTSTPMEFPYSDDDDEPAPSSRGKARPRASGSGARGKARTSAAASASAASPASSRGNPPRAAGRATGRGRRGRGSAATSTRATPASKGNDVDDANLQDGDVVMAGIA